MANGSSTPVSGLQKSTAGLPYMIVGPVPSTPHVNVIQVHGRTDTKKSLMDMEEALAVGNLSGAVEICERLIGSYPADLDVLLACARVLRHAGRHQAALDVARALLASGVNESRVHAMAGWACFGLRQFAGSVAHYRAAVELCTSTACEHRDEYRVRCAEALWECGEVAEAEGLLRRTVRSAPEMVEARFLLGRMAEAGGRGDEALAAYKETVRLDPAHTEALRHTGDILSDMGRLADALVAYRDAIEIEPNRCTLQTSVGSVCHALGLPRAAEAHLLNAVELNAGDIDARVALGKLQADYGRVDEAERCFDIALRMGPGYIPARLARIGVREKSGRHREAKAEALEILADAPDHPYLLNLLGRLARGERETSDIIDRIEIRLRDGRSVPKIVQGMLQFTLGQLYDTRGEYDAAFRCFKDGNDWRAAQNAYRKDTVASRFRRQREVFSKVVCGRASDGGDLGDKIIFIVGMPRSGTSLAEQILATHPDVYACGELVELGEIAQSSQLGFREEREPQLKAPEVRTEEVERMAGQYLAALPLEAGSALRVTDKMPHNFEHLGMISLLFPKARIVHCRRSPLDTSLSCFMQNFLEGNAFSYDLGDCGHFYRQYAGLMDHWRSVFEEPFFELQYETLVADPEPTVRALLEYCGLPWNDACLRFHENPRVVHTASYKQVREPFYTRSVGRWRHYAAYLTPLVEELGDLVPEADRAFIRAAAEKAGVADEGASQAAAG